MKYLLLMTYVSLMSVPGIAQAGSINIVGPFRGINQTDPSVTLQEGEAQDLLNVEVSQDGLSVSNRAGYSLLDSMTVSTGPIHGSILYRDANGANIEIYANDVSVFKSSNSGAYTEFITTATVGAKWSFCEAAGIVYAFNDKNDVPFSYDKGTVTRYNDSSIVPRASICAMTPTRMLLAGTTDFPNRLYFSAKGDYDNFTAGVDPEDPNFDDVGMAGDKITALWANAGEWLIWKTNSMISYQGTNQYDLVGSVISGKVGMSDPQARVEHNGIIYFRGTDARIWAYSGGILTDTTKKLETFISNATKDAPKNRQYSTKALWDLGTFSNTASTITNGAVEPWLVGFTDTTDADFNAGTASSVTVLNDKITINNFAEGTFPNVGFEMRDTTNWTGTPIISSGNWTGHVYYSSQTLGSWQVGGPSYYAAYRIYDQSDNVLLSGFVANPNAAKTINLASITDTVIKIGFGSYEVNAAAYTIPYKSVAFLKPESIVLTHKTISYVSGTGYSPCITNADNCVIYIDFPENIAVTSGTFTSQAFNTGTTSRKYCELVSTRTLPGSTYAIQYIQTSTDSVTWDLRANTSDYLSNSTTNQYVRYQIDFQDTTSYLKPSVEDISINCVATGTWTSDEFFTGSFTNWGLFLATATLTGNATWTFQISTSAVAGGTGSTWYTIQNSSAIGVSISSYVKVRAINSFFSSTETVRLTNVAYSYDITTAHMAAGFEYLGNIFFTVPYNGAVVNNRVMKLDLNAGGWSIFDIPMNAPLISGNNVHFGSPATSKIYNYPSGNNDESAAINAYWKSKDYMGDNVYVERTFDKMSIYLNANTASDVDITYSIEPATNTTFNISLAQSDGSLYIRNNRQLPAGTWGTLFNFKIGNNAADKPFRFYGAVIDYTNDGWRAYP